MNPSIRRCLLIVITLALIVTVPACGRNTEQAGSFQDPAVVAGLPVTDGPSGLRPGAPSPTRTAAGSDRGPVDAIAVQSVTDIEEFWKGSWGNTFAGGFTPARRLISWDSRARGGSFCGSTTAGLVNAAYCPADSSIGWDRGVLLPSLRKANGDMAITMVLAHEYGHAVQHQARLNPPNTPALVAEQQADCFAGAYLRWVAQGDSRRFQVSTGPGLNSLLASMIGFRDPLFTGNAKQAGGDEHGSAFERVSAFQFGFTSGPASCKAITATEVAKRRGNLPVALQRGQTGEWPVSKESVRAIIAALNILFKPAQPPALSFDAAQAAKCSDAKPSPPASFCPAANLITVDLPGLQKLGQAGDPRTGLSGDNTAYSVLISRYMLALQHAHGLPLVSKSAGLRTACLTGAATAKLARQVNTPDGNTVALTAGDLDEAVAGLLTNGLAASDVNGTPAPSGFARVDAFRSGVLGDEQLCLDRH